MPAFNKNIDFLNLKILGTWFWHGPNTTNAINQARRLQVVKIYKKFQPNLTSCYCLNIFTRKWQTNLIFQKGVILKVLTTWIMEKNLQIIFRENSLFYLFLEFVHSLHSIIQVILKLSIYIFLSLVVNSSNPITYN